MSTGSIWTCRRECGQASLLLLGVVTLLLGLAVALFAFGSALGSKGKHQRAADLAAVSAGQVMRELYPRLFEPGRCRGFGSPLANTGAHDPSSPSRTAGLTPPCGERG
jgi:hypothetical protein